ncbi:MAG: hypothetical protein H7A05_07930 [Pseudomonadales bacterium]|nr:hypothetical protein [Pseudomonadales bacterium]MCP5344534.1 hypothetical protein [Pseudomonadales bacterium]
MSVINTETLMASGRELLLPATLEICLHNHASDSVQTLELLQIFRVVPKRRIVALARWQGQRVVVKLFFARPRWAQHLEREVQGITAMQSVGMATATLLGHGELRDGHGGFVLLRYIEGGKNLSQCWQQASADDREAMLRRVLALIADCHERGLLQKDIHLNNFMLREEEIFLLDAGELEQFSQQPEGVDGVNSLRNLALFLAQFPVSNDERVPALYEEYRRQRPGLGLSEDIAVFRALLRKKRSLRLRTVLKKLYRETSANAFRRDWNHYIVYERALESADLQRFLQAPDRYIDEGVLIKGGRTATVAKVMIDGKPYVLKRYNIKSFWHRIRRLFQPSRAWVCWRNAHMLEMLGIATPKPLLMMEWRFGSLRREAYFLCEYVEGEDALHLLEKAPINSPAWSQALEQFKALFRVLRDYGIVHGDMKATNFLLTDRGLTVLDLDGMYQESDQRRFAKASAKDLQRFAKNWENDSERTQQVLTMLAQLQDESDYFTTGS